MAAPIQNITFRRRLLISIPENSIFLYFCIFSFCVFVFLHFVFLFVFLSLLMGIPPLTSDVGRKQSVLIRKRHLSMPMILGWERSDLDFEQMQHCQSVVRWNFRNPPLLENLIKNWEKSLFSPFTAHLGELVKAFLGDILWFSLCPTPVLRQSPRIMSPIPLHLRGVSSVVRSH